MSDVTPLVTATEIARLAGVSRATVSNWRRRHPDFPSPADGGRGRPVFDLAAVQKWLRAHGVDAELSPLQELRTRLRSATPPPDIAALIDRLAGFVRDGAQPPDGDVLADAVYRAFRDAGTRATLDALTEFELGDTAATIGAYRTPRGVAHLVADLIGAARGPAPAVVLDPACGGGTLLVAVGRLGARRIYGQDVVAVQTHRADAVLSLTEPDAQVTIRTGGSLTADAFTELKADAVVCHPPFGVRDWGTAELSLDARWEFGVPPRGESELAWVQHVLAHLRPGGIGVILVPSGVASRPGGRRIRGELLRRGAIRAVIALPAGVLAGTQVGVQVWVLRKPDTDPADEVLFVDATSSTIRSHGDATADRLEFATEVVSSWEAFERGDNEGAMSADVATVVRVVDVLDEQVDLTPSKYVRVSFDADGLGDAVTAATTRLDEELTALRSAFDAVRGPVATGHRDWRTATVSDLVTGGALELLTPRPSKGDPVAASDLGCPVLTGRDVVLDCPPSRTVDTDWPTTMIRLEPGDVVIPQLQGAHAERALARVADEQDAGTVIGAGLFVLRPDPSRLDPWFVAGFACDPDNAVSTIGTTTRLIPSRIRIPLLPLAEQRPYGVAFRHMSQLKSALRRAERSASGMLDLLSTGFTAGALEPQPLKSTASKGRK